MSNRLAGRVGEVLKIGLGARNWLLAHMKGTDEQFMWIPPEGGRSAKELVDHVIMVILGICHQLSESLGVVLEINEPVQVEGVAFQLSEEVQAAYDTFKGFCGKLNDEILDTVITLPPPARLREGTVETILRIMMAYHVVHHSGQMAALLRRSKGEP